MRHDKGKELQKGHIDFGAVRLRRRDNTCGTVREADESVVRFKARSPAERPQAPSSPTQQTENRRVRLLEVRDQLKSYF